MKKSFLEQNIRLEVGSVADSIQNRPILDNHVEN